MCSTTLKVIDVEVSFEWFNWWSKKSEISYNRNSNYSLAIFRLTLIVYIIISHSLVYLYNIPKNHNNVHKIWNINNELAIIRFTQSIKWIEFESQKIAFVINNTGSDIIMCFVFCHCFWSYFPVCVTVSWSLLISFTSAFS